MKVENNINIYNDESSKNQISNYKSRALIFKVVSAVANFFKKISFEIADTFDSLRYRLSYGNNVVSSSRSLINPKMSHRDKTLIYKEVATIDPLQREDIIKNSNYLITEKTEFYQINKIINAVYKIKKDKREEVTKKVKSLITSKTEIYTIISLIEASETFKNWDNIISKAKDLLQSVLESFEISCIIETLDKIIDTKKDIIDEVIEQTQTLITLNPDELETIKTNLIKKYPLSNSINSEIEECLNYSNILKSNKLYDIIITLSNLPQSVNKKELIKKVKNLIIPMISVSFMTNRFTLEILESENLFFISNILKALSNIPAENWDNVIKKTQDLKLEETTPDFINALSKIPVENWDKALEKVHDLSKYLASHIINALSKIPVENWDNVTQKVKPLTQFYLGWTIKELILAAKAIPNDRWEIIYQKAQPLVQQKKFLGSRSYESDLFKIIHSLNKITDTNEMDKVIKQTKFLISPNTIEIRKSDILEALVKIPSTKRDNVVEHAKKLITFNTNFYELNKILNDLKEMSPNERALYVEKFKPNDEPSKVTKTTSCYGWYSCSR